MKFHILQGHDDDEDMEDEDDGEGQTVVWGTNIHVPTLCRRIRRFLRNFEEEGAHEPKYLALLRQASAILLQLALNSEEKYLNHQIWKAILAKKILALQGCHQDLVEALHPLINAVAASIIKVKDDLFVSLAHAAIVFLYKQNQWMQHAFEA